MIIISKSVLAIFVRSHTTGNCCNLLSYTTKRPRLTRNTSLSTSLIRIYTHSHSVASTALAPHLPTRASNSHVHTIYTEDQTPISIYTCVNCTIVLEHYNCIILLKREPSCLVLKVEPLCVHLHLTLLSTSPCVVYVAYYPVHTVPVHKVNKPAYDKHPAYYGRLGDTKTSKQADIPAHAVYTLCAFPAAQNYSKSYIRHLHDIDIV